MRIIETKTPVANIDILREKRTLLPEVILSEGKTKEQVLAITKKILRKNARVLITRVSEDVVFKLKKLEKKYEIVYNHIARVCIVKSKEYKIKKLKGTVGVISAGTSDLPVAEEAGIVCEYMGLRVMKAYDVGVAGIHRLFPQLKRMIDKGVDVYIVVAGREGTLPAIVAGMVNAPVIGVPVSTGYGAGGRGKSALYSMLQSCTPIVVVNIDAGFVAGAVASQIVRRCRR